MTEERRGTRSPSDGVHEVMRKSRLSLYEPVDASHDQHKASIGFGKSVVASGNIAQAVVQGVKIATVVVRKVESESQVGMHVLFSSPPRGFKVDHAVSVVAEPRDVRAQHLCAPEQAHGPTRGQPVVQRVGQSRVGIEHSHRLTVSAFSHVVADFDERPDVAADRALDLACCAEMRTHC